MRLSRALTRCYFGLLFGGIAILLLGVAIQIVLVSCIGIAVMLLGVGVCRLKCRCPHCSSLLFRSLKWSNDGRRRYCPDCGNEIVYDDDLDLCR